MPHGHEVYQALYSPDGARLVTASETAVKVWNTATGALIHEMTAKSDGRTPSDFYRAAISPDGRLIAAADAAGSVVHVWDADGALVAQLRLRADAFPRLAFSHDGVWLAATGGHEARVFAVRTWKQITEVPGQIHSIEFDARGRLLTGAATGDVALWKIPNSERLLHLRQFGEAVDAVAFSPDGQLLAAGSRDGAIQVWHANGALVSQLNPRRSKVHAIEFDESSKLLLAANADGTVVVADVAQGLPLTTLEGPRNIIRTAHFGPHLQVVAASSDGTARLWDATSPYRRWSADPMGDCGVIMSPEPDERYVAVGCRDRAVRIWDTARDQELAELPSSTSIATGGYTSAFPAVSSDGSRAAISRGNYVQLYELPGGRLMRTIRHGAQVSSVAFASRGLDVVSGAVDGSVFITSEDGAQMALQEPAGIDLAQVLADGRVVVADAERRLRFHSSAGALLADLETPTRIMSFRSDGSHAIALPSYLANAAAPLLIDLERFRVIAQLQGHIGQVFSARWVSGNHVLTAGADGTANLWDGGSGRLLQTYRGSPRFLADATVTPDGLVIAGDANGLLRFWNAATGDLLWALQAHKSAVIGVHVEHGDIVTRGFNGEISRWRIPSSEQVLESCAGNTACGIVTK
jgi:WD40 repeat protein